MGKKYIIAATVEIAVWAESADEAVKRFDNKLLGIRVKEIMEVYPEEEPGNDDG